MKLEHKMWIKSQVEQARMQPKDVKDRILWGIYLRMENYYADLEISKIVQEHLLEGIQKEHDKKLW